MLSDLIYARLAATAGVVDVCADRIYWMKPPGDLGITEPAVVFQCISDVPEKCIDGTTAYRVARYQVSVFSDSLPEAVAVREAIIEAVENHTEVGIIDSQFESAVEVEPEQYGMYQASADFMIWHV